LAVFRLMTNSTWSETQPRDRRVWHLSGFG
jgi:hypothetical protein